MEAGEDGELGEAGDAGEAGIEVANESWGDQVISGNHCHTLKSSLAIFWTS